MGAAPLVAGVAAQIEEVLDVQMPGLEVGAGGAAALAAAVDGQGDVAGDLQKRHHPLALHAGAVNGGAGGADVAPVVAQAAGPLGELGVVAQRLEDAGEVVVDGGQVAGAELRAAGAGVEQGRGGGYETQARDQLVEADRLLVALLLGQRHPHGRAHPERLRGLYHRTLDAGEVAFVQGLHAHVPQQVVPLRAQGGRQPLQVEVEQAAIEGSGVHPALQAVAEGPAVVGVEPLAGQRGADHLLVDALQEQARGELAVRWIALDERGAGQQQRLLYLGRRDAVVDVADGLARHLVHGHRRLQAVSAGAALAGGGAADAAGELGDVEQHLAVVARLHGEAPEQGLARRPLLALFARLLALGAIQDVRLGDLVQAVLDQVFLDDVLDVLDVGVELDEAGVDFVDDSGHHPAESAVLERVPLVAWRGGADRLGDRHADALAVEVDHLAGPLDDHQAHVLPPMCLFFNQARAVPGR